jgi:uncharacterized repeat protein (TIGR04042 family)
MPEIHFQVEWPDGVRETCYSPSLVVRDYFTAGNDYSLEDFIARSRTSLKIASDRVMAKYGVPCSRALSQLQRIEAMANKYSRLPQPRVRLIRFVEQFHGASSD